MIKEKLEKRAEELRELIEASGDITEVRNLGEELRDVTNQLKAIEEMNNDPASAVVRANLRSGVNSANVSDALILRSDESILRKTEKTQILDLGKFIRGAVTGNWVNATAEMNACNNARSVSGIVLPQVLSAQVIDAARNVSLFTSAGVGVVPMDSDNLTFARVKTDPVFEFKGRGQTQEDENSLELDSVELKSKTAYGYAYVNIEDIVSAKNLTSVLTQAFSQAMADCIDKAMLYGDGTTNAPSGILNDSDINTVTATNRGYRDYVKAIGSVRRANGTPTVIGMNADVEELMSLMTDDNGQPLNAPKSVENLTRVISNQLKYDETTGSDAIVFDPLAMLVGMQRNITVEIFSGTDTGIKNGQVCFRIMAMLDAVAVRPKHISLITGIKESNE